LYSEINAKIECVLYAGHTKRESNIWHNLGRNTITLFFNINDEYMNHKQIYYVCFLCCLSTTNLIVITAMTMIILSDALFGDVITDFSLLSRYVIERNSKKGPCKDYSKQGVNYFQSWHQWRELIINYSKQHQATWSSRRYLSSHSGRKWPGIKLTQPSVPNRSRSTIDDDEFFCFEWIFWIS